ncbi:MAG: sterol desaturase family protein [Rhodospirillales bacterium]|jgi:sterol desaturase/sphingolipid hydroxylase (fatty acid hydroxylase superfamily)|nr:sterol desaturase family protein [Rhodospirillales bacterium]
MTAFLLDHEGWLRLAAFVGMLIAMLAWERLRPLRAEPNSGRPWLGQRRIANFGLAAIDTILLRLLLPGAAVGAALWAQVNGIGLFNGSSFVGPVAGAVALLLAIVLLDLAVWVQHVASHKLPVLWRLHRVHHSDVHFDATTAIRFHPIEILASMIYKIGVVIVLGAPAAAVIVFEIVLNASALFNHGNVQLPTAIDRRLRAIIVTPDFHRVHHSVRRCETDSNYGFFLSVWDRLFGTYRSRPQDDPVRMPMGLDGWRQETAQTLPALLAQPFKGSKTTVGRVVP